MINTPLVREDVYSKLTGIHPGSKATRERVEAELSQILAQKLPAHEVVMRLHAVMRLEGSW